MKLGVIEGFFGPAWSEEARFSYASFLEQCGGDFYIYAPKQDQFLRKKWRETWDNEYQVFLSGLAQEFKASGVKFGVALSPFALGDTLTEEDQTHLKNKVTLLDKLGVDVLGIFFDDMPVQDNLAKSQIAAVNFIKTFFTKEIIFCPTFYTYDPILEKVFGKMPENYLSEIALGIDTKIHLAWTGPKVISPEIPNLHLHEVREILKRKPFIWENVYANDGPKNCKFLKLKPFTGRENEFQSLVSGCGLNMMNQPYLSQITFLSSKLVIDGESPKAAWENAIELLCSPSFGEFLFKHQDKFLNLGLDQFSSEMKHELVAELLMSTDPAALEVIDWLEGKYIVGSECLTD